MKVEIEAGKDLIRETSASTQGRPPSKEGKPPLPSMAEADDVN